MSFYTPSAFSRKFLNDNKWCQNDFTAPYSESTSEINKIAIVQKIEC